jgi:hypothetical protein
MSSVIVVVIFFHARLLIAEPLDLRCDEAAASRRAGPGRVSGSRSESVVSVEIMAKVVPSKTD